MLITKPLIMINRELIDMNTKDKLVKAGAELRKLRSQTGLSTYKVGKRVGVSGNYVAKIERGESNPSDALLDAFAELYSKEREEMYWLFNRLTKEELEKCREINPILLKAVLQVLDKYKLSDEQAILFSQKLMEMSEEIIGK